MIIYLSKKKTSLKKLAVIFFVSLLASMVSFGQDSCRLRISLLTCSPGAELYSTFGHTAIRVEDSLNNRDLIFNYGTFEFGPDFYSKFVRGKLLYYLSVEDYPNFIYQYQMESRSIIEQQLNLSCPEKQKLFQALLVNAQEQNKYYLYDFLYDNCTTRARDIVAANTSKKLVFNNILPAEGTTFRNEIHIYLDRAGQYWSKLGIDLLLGAKVDKKVTNTQSMFLPEYLMKGFDHAEVSGKALVAKKQVILQMPEVGNGNSLFTPMAVFSLLLVLVVALSFSRSAVAQSVMKYFDLLFFLVLGLVGLLILFMWIGTDHKVTQNNWNILWAFPLDVVVVPFILSGKRWVKGYFLGMAILCVLLLIGWFFLPQQMNNAFLPVVVLIIFRSFAISKGLYGAKRNKIPG